MTETSIVLKIDGMTCEGCAQSVQQAVRRMRGVRDAQVDWQAERGEVSFDPDQTSAEAILRNPVFQLAYKATLI